MCMVSATDDAEECSRNAITPGHAHSASTQTWVVLAVALGIAAIHGKDAHVGAARHVLYIEGTLAERPEFHRRSTGG